MKGKTQKPTVAWREVRSDWLKDPAVAAAYQANGPVMEMAFALAEARPGANCKKERTGLGKPALFRGQRRS